MFSDFKILYHPSQESFATPSKYTEFKTCRESFTYNFRVLKRHGNLLFSTNDKIYKTKENIEKLIWFVEDKLGVQRSLIDDTHHENIYCIRLSSFWLTYSIRLNFLTALLKTPLHKELFNYRLGEYEYKFIGKDIDTNYLLYNNYYFKQTKEAAELFLSGYTIPARRLGNWVDTFSDKDKEDIKKCLIKE